MEPAALSAIGGLLTIIGGGIAWYVKRRDAKSAEISRIRVEEANLDDAAVDRMDRVASMIEGRLLAEITRQGTRLKEQAEQIACLQTADLEKGHELTRLRSQVRRLVGVLGREVAAVIDWIDRGASPPPPTTEVNAIRDLIADLDADA